MLNELIIDRINAYMADRRDQYAVLVCAPWGAGKTHFIKQNFADRAELVSLFSLNSAFSLELEIIEVFSPNAKKAHDYIERAKSTTSKVGGWMAIANLFQYSPSLSVETVKKSKKIIVIDDIERSSIPVEEVLGVIDKYVQLGVKIAVLTHRDKLGENFKEIEEKVFGEKYFLETPMREAISSFLDDYTRDYSEIKNYQSELIDLTAISESTSLRVVRAAIREIARLGVSLDLKHFADESLKQELVNTLFVLILEYRSGLIELDEIFELNDVDRTTHHIDRNTDNCREDFSQRFTGLNVNLDLFPDSIWKDMLTIRPVEPKLVFDFLKENSEARGTDEGKPAAWYRLIKLDEMPDSEVRIAYADMLSLEKSNAISDLGVLLHHVSLMMLMSTIGMDNRSFEQIETHYYHIIENMDSLDHLTLRRFDRSVASMRSYGGQGFWVQDEYREHFDNVAKRALEVWEQSRLREARKALLSMIKKFDQSGVKHSSFSDTIWKDFGVHLDAVLPTIDKDEFVKAFLENERYFWLDLISSVSCSTLTSSNEGRQWSIDIKIELNRLYENETDPLRKFSLDRVSRFLFTR